VKDIVFPLYRKYANNRSYFKIISETEFEELQVFGNRCSIYSFKANIYPDHVRIQDMILGGLYWQKSNEEEYECIKKHCEQYLEKSNG